MATNYKLDVEGKQEIFIRAEEYVDFLLEKGIIELKVRTPEDTFELTSSYRVENAKAEGDTVTGSLYVEPTSPASEYANLVEIGVPSRKFNYYKNSGRRLGGVPFYSGVGARMFFFTKRYLEKFISSLS